MDKRVSIGFAVSIIIIIGGFLAGVIYVGSKMSDIEAENKKIATQKNSVAPVNSDELKVVECKAHYYNGEAQINAWKISDDAQGGVIVQILNEDVKNLPVNADKAMTVESNPRVDLVDPSEDVKASLANATSEKPTVITVRGYAETCESLIPSVSMNLATVALKKS
jgi:hypothetical protein